MKCTKIFAAATLLVSSIILGSIAVQAAPVGQKDSKGLVDFVPNDELTHPKNPNQPGEDVDPLDPEDPSRPIEPGTPGPLSLDFASSFSFGKNKISSQDQEYNAKPQSLKDGRIVPNYVQVTDNRGTESGWVLSVKQNGQFISKSGKELVGAQLAFSNANMNTISISEKPSSTELFTLTPDGNGAKVNLVNASKGSGAGTWIYRFGTDDQKDKSVKLIVPGKTPKLAERYHTTLTWTLSETPLNE